jgi:hypothetical protein
LADEDPDRAADHHEARAELRDMIGRKAHVSE